jgi:galactokinase
MKIDSPYFRKNLEILYGEDAENQEKEYRETAIAFQKRFAMEPEYLFSSPGRTELCGNHTDHNNGIILAGAINLDKIAAVAPRKDNRIEIITEGFSEEVFIDITSDALEESEKETSASLVRGIAALYREKGFKTGGFSAMIRSRVAMGSGLSSSASIEILIGKIFSFLFNKNSIDPLTLALVGQEAENRYFGKPCGLMDQLACAQGGVIAVDFKDPREPLIEKLDFHFNAYGYVLTIVHAGGSHADLTSEYAAIPEEMRMVAQFFGKKQCREVEKQEIVHALQQLRSKVGDRAILRALHFLDENERVMNAVRALKKRDIVAYLDCIKASSASSKNLLQNIFSGKSVREQGISLSLALIDHLLAEHGGQGVSRVHGGGFAGTVQAYIPKELFPLFKREMESLLGPGCVTSLSIRSFGPLELSELK